MKQNVRGPLVLQSPFSYNIEIYMYKYIKNIFYFIVPSLDNFYTNMPVLTWEIVETFSMYVRRN